MFEEYSHPTFEMKIAQAVMPSAPQQGAKEKIWREIQQHAGHAYHTPMPKHSWNRRRWLPLSLAVLLLVVVLAFTNPQVVTAMQRLFRFLPGIGLVETSQFKVLEEQVVVEREGITVTVSEAAGDAQRTRILMQVEGLSSDYNWGDFQDDSLITQDDDPFLILSDGSILLVEGAMHHGDGSGKMYIHRLTFPPLPPDTMQVILAIPRILPSPPGAEPQNWQIPLRFKAGDPDLLDPVFEIEPQEDEFSLEQKLEGQADTPDCCDAPVPSAAGNGYGVQFNLERVADLEDGYLFMTKTSWQSDTVLPYSMFADLISVTDANGNAVAWEYAEADQMAEVGEKAAYGAFRVIGKEYAMPLTLQVRIVADIEADASFLFEAGQQPQIGQTWQTDMLVSIPPYDLRIVGVEAVSDAHGGTGYEFTMQSDNVFRAMLVDQNNPRGGAGGGGGGGVFDDPPFTFSSTISYFELPQDTIEVGVSSIAVILDGTWQVTWQPE